MLGEKKKIDVDLWEEKLLQFTLIQILIAKIYLPHTVW